MEKVLPQDQTLKLANRGQRANLLPFRAAAAGEMLTCSNCRFVNSTAYNFCTGCGFPLAPNQDRLALYRLRIKQRDKLLQKAMDGIAGARNVLYVSGTICMVGIVYLFEESRTALVKGFVLLVIATLFVGLARWTNVKPFTALLVSFLVTVTIVAINTWSQFTEMFITVTGLYVFLAQLLLLYFVTRGLKSAYHADILREEMA